MTTDHSSIHHIAGQLLPQLTIEERKELTAWSYSETFRQAMGRYVNPVIDQLSSEQYLLFQQLANGTDPATAVLQEMRKLEMAHLAAFQ